jgi:hypothetical protein
MSRATLDTAAASMAAVALGEWIRGRYGETGAYLPGGDLHGDDPDDGWRDAGRALVSLVEQGADPEHERTIYEACARALAVEERARAAQSSRNLQAREIDREA